MRLIDRDAIPWQVDGVGKIPVVTEEEIDEMPEVVAVPIKLIEKVLDGFEEIRNAVTPNTDTWRMWDEKAKVLDTLIDVWLEKKDEYEID